jgi:hypothetical protein
MFGIKRASTVQDYKDTLPLPITHVNGTITYQGFCQVLGTKTTEPKWLIIRTTVSGGVTTPEYASGSMNFDQVWEDRESLNYSR